MFFKSKNRLMAEPEKSAQQNDTGYKLQQLLKEHGAKVQSLAAEVRRQKREIAQYRRRFAREDEYLFDSYPLTQIADRLNQHLDYHSIIRNLLDICTDLRGIKSTGAFLKIEDKWDSLGSINHPIYPALFEELSETNLLNKLESERETIQLKATNYREILETDEDTGTVLLIPLHSENQFWGMLIVFSVLSEKAVGGAFQGQLEMLAAQTSVALRYTYVYKDLETTHFELARSQSMLVRAARMAATGEVAGGVAHEINNPLQIILGKIQIARLKNDPSMLEDVEMQVIRIATIVQGLQNIALESATDTKKLSDLNQVLVYAISLVESQLVRRGINVELIKGTGMPAAQISATTLRQTIVAFLIFCKKRLSRGGELKITTSVQDGDCLLIFEDDGIELSETLRRQLKEPLSASGKYGESEENFGIIICALLVKEGNGAVIADRLENGRSRITMRFPAYGAMLAKSKNHTDVVNEIVSEG
ncbi:MAG: hypothetical protein ACRBF0_12020 [Calditrichia bacterium]